MATWLNRLKPYSQSIGLAAYLGVGLQTAYHYGYNTVQSKTVLAQQPDSEYLNSQISPEPRKYTFNSEIGRDYDYVPYLNRDGLTVFSQSYCVYCVKLRTLLDEMGVAYKNIEVDEGSMPDHAINQLCHSTGASTFPKLFIKDNFYQGYGETHMRRDNGTLAEIFKNENIPFERD